MLANPENEQADPMGKISLPEPEISGVVTFCELVSAALRSEGVEAAISHFSTAQMAGKLAAVYKRLR